MPRFNKNHSYEKEIESIMDSLDGLRGWHELKTVSKFVVYDGYDEKDRKVIFERHFINSIEQDAYMKAFENVGKKRDALYKKLEDGPIDNIRTLPYTKSTVNKQGATECQDEKN